MKKSLRLWSCDSDFLGRCYVVTVTAEGAFRLALAEGIRYLAGSEPENLAHDSDAFRKSDWIIRRVGGDVEHLDHEQVVATYGEHT